MLKKSYFALFILITALLSGCAGSGGDNSLAALLLGFGKNSMKYELTYSEPDAVYQQNVEIVMVNVPTVNDTVLSWAIDPALPDGMSLDPTFGIISGKPTTHQPRTPYSVTANFSGGSATADIWIEITEELPAPPSGLSYTTPVAYTQGVAITPNVPTVTGAVTSWSVDPGVPEGLMFDGATGTISGTPIKLQSSTQYTVTAGNSGGSTTADIWITINAVPPSGLSYTTPVTYTQGVAITPNEPTVTGAVTSWSVDPSLPSGLSLNPDTGVISGTPTVVHSATQYTVTAGNSGGSTTADVWITINAAPPAPPSGLSYTTPVTYIQGVAITPNVPTVTGAVTSWSVDPALPAGLSLNTDTGVISGTPTTVQSAAQYTVTAGNAGGSTSADVWIAVDAPPIPPPSGLSYATPVVYTIASAITPNEPEVTGTVTLWSVDPALPAGLALDPDTGVISGTPTAVQSAAQYTVTAGNAGGSTTADVWITVSCGAAAGAVSNLTATSGTHGDRVVLNWDAADNAIFYRIYRAQVFLSGSTPAVQVGGDIYGTEFNDMTAGPGLHSYYVVAYSYCGAGGTSGTVTGYRTITDYEFFAEGYAELEPLMAWLATADFYDTPQTVPGTVTGQFVYEMEIIWFVPTATLTFTDFCNYYLTVNGTITVTVNSSGDFTANGTLDVTGLYSGYVRFDDIQISSSGEFIGGNYAVSQDGGATETIIPGDYIPGD